MSLRDALGAAQDAYLFEDAPCTDLTNLLWDPQHEEEKLSATYKRQALAAQICRDACRAIEACRERRDLIRAAKRLTAGVWAGEAPSTGGGKKRTSGCGSPGGYQAHRKRDEKPCDACADAHRRYMAAYMAARRSV